MSPIYPANIGIHNDWAREIIAGDKGKMLPI